MTAWAHLPNAALIDEVLASVKTNPKGWDVAWDATREIALIAAWDAARGAARGAAWDAAWGTARDAVWVAARNAVWAAARDVLGAPVAYDDAGRFMKLPVEHLQSLYRIDPHPMFLLLQPAAIVFDPRTTP